MLGDPFRRESRYSVSKEPPLLSRLPWQAPLLQPQGGQLGEDDANRGDPSSRMPGTIPESHLFDRQRGLHNSVSHSASSSVPAGVSHANQAKNGEVFI